VFHATTATVHKASDCVFSFCETYVPRIQHLNTVKTTELCEHACLTVSSLFNYVFHSVQSSLIWSRMLTWTPLSYSKSGALK
ncbi:unnamed protein product, partial [Rotaria sordida]